MLNIGRIIVFFCLINYDPFGILCSSLFRRFSRKKKKMIEDSDDTESKYRKILLANTLLDNERYVFSFEIDNLRDEYNVLDDDCLHERRLLRDKVRAYDLLKRDYAKLKNSCIYLEHCINRRDDLLEKNGLCYLQLRPFRSFCDIKTAVHCDEDADDDSVVEDEIDSVPYNQPKSSAVLLKAPSNAIDQFVISFFNNYDKSSLDEELKNVISERITLLQTVGKLREEVKTKRQENLDLEEKVYTDSCKFIKSSDVEALETQQGNIRLLKEYRDKLKNTTEKINCLKNKLTYLESELNHLKSQHHDKESVEVQLHNKKRQSLRQLREVEAKIGELEGLNNLLFKKLDKINKSKHVVS